jgi:hypothetical protein
MRVVLVIIEDIGAAEGESALEPHAVVSVAASTLISVAERVVPARVRALVCGRPISTGPTVTSW